MITKASTNRAKANYKQTAIDTIRAKVKPFAQNRLFFTLYKPVSLMFIHNPPGKLIYQCRRIGSVNAAEVLSQSNIAVSASLSSASSSGRITFSSSPKYDCNMAWLQVTWPVTW